MTKNPQQIEFLDAMMCLVTPQSITRTLRDLEIEAIRKALNRHNNNWSDTAKALGIGRTTLYRKCGEYNIT